MNADDVASQKHVISEVTQPESADFRAISIPRISPISKETIEPRCFIILSMVCFETISFINCIISTLKQTKTQ